MLPAERLKGASEGGGTVLDLSIRLGNGLRTRIVERPGRSLDQAALNALVADVRKVASATLPAEELQYGVLGGDPERLQHAVLTVVYDVKSGAPVAFNALSIMELELRGRPMEVLHLGLVMVDPAVRQRGLTATLYGLTCVLLFLERRGHPIWVSNVTQVPAIAGMVSETYSGVWPRLAPGGRRTFDHVSLARQIMAGHRHVFGVGGEANFDEARFVIEDAYTGGSDGLKKTFEQAPKHRTALYNEACVRELNYDRGDDLLQLGRIDMEAAARYVAKVAPPSTGVGLIGLAIFAAVRATIVPLMQWLAADRQMGVLRPWPR